VTTACARIIDPTPVEVWLTPSSTTSDRQTGDVKEYRQDGASNDTVVTDGIFFTRVREAIQTLKNW
jgi:hypothetical protein